ncbi:hypothetical protein PybrP1_009393 [[Pythium] brassicae (nom. inval.)]|nr:hypothetical protein PybrP1_009393 [[Pythium] brassicae (nom. inval.)]
MTRILNDLLEHFHLKRQITQALYGGRDRGARRAQAQAAAPTGRPANLTTLPSDHRTKRCQMAIVHIEHSLLQELPKTLMMLPTRIRATTSRCSPRWRAFAKYTWCLLPARTRSDSSQPCWVQDRTLRPSMWSARCSRRRRCGSTSSVRAG